MHTYLLQDWITVQFPVAGPTTVLQPSEGWLNLQNYRDLQFWIDVGDIEPAGGTVTLLLQHAPVRDEFLFYPSITSLALTATGLTVRSAMFDYAAQPGTGNVPFSKWLRWKLTGPSANWAVMFRILVSAGGIGTGKIPARLLSRLAD